MIVDSIRFKGHTCFKTGWSGFDTVKPINVIIGRNNSGKSHLLDLVEALCSGAFHSRAWQYRCEGSLDETSLKRYFDANTSEASPQTHETCRARRLGRRSRAPAAAPSAA